MSNYHTYRDAVFASDLTAPQKVLALAISYHYNWKDGSPAFPSNSTLSRETSLAISSIVRAKKVLSERGFIVMNQRFNNSSEYTPAIPEHLVCPQRETNNEYNNELNNEKDKKDSNESFEPIINMNQEVVEPIFEVVKEEAPAAAPRPGSTDYYLKLAESLEW